MIRKAVLTGAKINDSERGDELICGDERMVYADKGYDSGPRRQLLARLGIADGILRRAAWGTARTPAPALTARNRRLAPIRAPIERIIATVKRRYGLWRARYRSVPRNQIHLSLICIAANLRRAWCCWPPQAAPRPHEAAADATAAAANPAAATPHCRNRTAKAVSKALTIGRQPPMTQINFRPPLRNSLLTRARRGEGSRIVRN